MNFKIRKLQKDEFPILKKLLYEAVFIPEGMEPPLFEIIKDKRQRALHIERRALAAMSEWISAAAVA